MSTKTDWTMVAVFAGIAACMVVFAGIVVAAAMSANY